MLVFVPSGIAFIPRLDVSTRLLFFEKTTVKYRHYTWLEDSDFQYDAEQRLSLISGERRFRHAHRFVFMPELKYQPSSAAFVVTHQPSRAYFNHLPSPTLLFHNHFQPPQSTTFNMPVNTISADNVVFVNGRPTIAPSLDASNNQGKKPTKPYKPRVSRYKCRAEQLKPRLHLVTPGSPVAFDCKGLYLFENIGKEKRGVGRRLKLGVKYNDIKPENGAQAHADVLEAVKSVFDKSGIVVGHAVHEDIWMLRPLSFGGYTIHCTQAKHTKGIRGRYKPGLKDLTEELLGREIQGKEHSSVEDARATMDIFLLDWTASSLPTT
ncbi:hypothetical protein Q7P37_010783 [Cladosporium fusiforme]